MGLGVNSAGDWGGSEMEMEARRRLRLRGGAEEEMGGDSVV